MSEERCSVREAAQGCLPTELPDESVLMPLWLTATKTSLKTMRAILCHESGDVIEIPPPHSPPTHQCIFPMISQLRGYIFPVRRKRSGHEAQACICNHMHKNHEQEAMFVNVDFKSCDFFTPSHSNESRTVSHVLQPRDAAKCWCLFRISGKYWHMIREITQFLFPPQLKVNIMRVCSCHMMSGKINYWEVVSICIHHQWVFLWSSFFVPIKQPLPLVTP